MKLIDVDRIADDRGSEFYYRMNNGELVVVDFKHTPTVEAIPIAWLTKRYCAAGVFASPSYHKRADIVRQIIRDYKREQEQIGETE